MDEQRGPTQTWRVAVTFERNDGHLRSVASVVDGPLRAVGHGEVRLQPAGRDEVLAQAQAARRSLDDLGRMLSYLADLEALCTTDQA